MLSDKIKNVNNLRVALVHDYLIRFGGAERVLLAFHKMFPRAPIYTLLHDEKKMKRFFPDADIKTSFLQKFPRFLKNSHRFFLPLLPSAVETFDLSDFDMVISSSNSFAKGIITKPKCVHICYCQSPTRFLWDWYYNYQEKPFRDLGLEIPRKIFKEMPLKILLHLLRIWDRQATDRVDYFIAISKTVQQRIWKYYRREAKVIYPPCVYESGIMNYELRSGGNSDGIQNNNKSDNSIILSDNVILSPSTIAQGKLREGSRDSSPLDKLGAQNDKNHYFLIVSQLAPHKRIDLAIQAFNKLEFPLVIIGEGKEKNKLKKMARENIKFLGWQPDKIASQYYQNCLAFVFPGEEDFGIAPVEAMSFGKPVLAYRKGGLIESVIEGVTGEFFNDPHPAVLADAARRLMENIKNYSPIVIRKRAEKFSRERFEKEMISFLNTVITNTSEQRTVIINK